MKHLCRITSAIVIALFLYAVPVLAADEMENLGYTFLDSLDSVRLQGQFKEQTLDISIYSGLGNEPAQYALVDKKRNIEIYSANNKSTYHFGIMPSDGFGFKIFEKADLLVRKDADIIHWDAGSACPYPEAVDALHNLQRAYDYYRDTLGWDPDVNGVPFFTAVVVDVDEWDKHGDGNVEKFRDNAVTLYNSETNMAMIGIGQKKKNTRTVSGSPEIIGHEFTHAVFYQKDIQNETAQGKCIHEGYCDVIGICVGEEDDSWVYADDYNSTRRDLKNTKVKHVKKVNYKKNAHYNGRLFGYAASLMNGQDIKQGESLDRTLIGKLFYRSMNHLDKDPTFLEAGYALHCAAKELCAEGVLTEEHATRVDAVLEEVGLLNHDEAAKADEIHLRERNAKMLLMEFLQKELIPAYGIMSTETLFDTESRTNNELSGILSANIDDYDGDGIYEMLVNIFKVEDGAQIGKGISDELVLTMQMYEVSETIFRSAETHVLMLGLTEIMGKYGTSASCFQIQSGNEKWIAFDAYYGVNENTTTLSLYRYVDTATSPGFIYKGGAGFQEYGEGTILARSAEPDSDQFWAVATNCSDWWAILMKCERRSAWKTDEKWSTEAHDWTLPSDDVRKHMYDLYRGQAARIGVTVSADQRIIPIESDWMKASNARFTQNLEDIYGTTPGMKGLWSIVSYSELDGRMQLLRKDLQGTLDEYR